MTLDFHFYITGIMLGVGLAMDAFSVSLANGLNCPNMKIHRMCVIAGIFAFFQFAMPLIGWFCVSSIANIFSVFEKFIPIIALVLLSFIGGKMLLEGIKNGDSQEEKTATSFFALIVQGIATSIDALSVGFTVAHCNFPQALVLCALIGAVTFGICLFGVILGKKAGSKLSRKAGILGGSILIFIGLQIFVKSILQN